MGSIFIEIYSVGYDPNVHGMMGLADLLSIIPQLKEIDVNDTIQDDDEYFLFDIVMKQIHIVHNHPIIDNILVVVFTTLETQNIERQLTITGAIIDNIESRVLSSTVTKTGHLPIPDFGFCLVYENIDSGKYLQHFINCDKEQITFH